MGKFYQIEQGTRERNLRTDRQGPRALLNGEKNRQKPIDSHHEEVEKLVPEERRQRRLSTYKHWGLLRRSFDGLQA